MSTPDGLPSLACESREAWERWLEEHHESSPGLWLEIAKKGSGIVSVTYADALEVALCFGWIDGRKGRLDEARWRQRFTRRRARSRWSRINREAATRLIEAGRMRDAGLAEVELARADGRWDAAYDSPATATVPDDLRAALDASPPAAEAFAALDGANRYAVLHRIQEAKRAETRARRIARLVEMLAEGGTIHPRPHRRGR